MYASATDHTAAAIKVTVLRKGLLGWSCGRGCGFGGAVLGEGEARDGRQEGGTCAASLHCFFGFSFFFLFFSYFLNLSLVCFDGWLGLAVALLGR
jgi:hypothetical protein